MCPSVSRACPCPRAGLLFAVLVLTMIASPTPAAHAGTLRDPISPSQQTALQFGDRSHWLQPWRGYLETVPAERLRRAIGINFNVEPSEAESTARLLARSGFKRARVELDWGALDYGDPGRFRNEDSVRIRLRALRDNGIRPLILLNSNDGIPCPTRFFDVDLALPAPAGSRTLQLTPDSARDVIAGRTGLNGPDGKAAAILFKDVGPAGTVTLAKPLTQALSQGAHAAATLRYEPFGPPRLASGAVNPAFESTMRGWLDYVDTAVSETRRDMGSYAFDVEVWNELSFGSDFLYADRYYDPARERGQGEVENAILDRTVARLRDRVPREVGITDGFASQTPFASGATTPPALTALSKHPYHGLLHFPADATMNSDSPLDALGRPSFTETPLPGTSPLRRDEFVPRYDAFFPEYYLSAIQTESLVRDISPLTSDIYGTPHGRRAHPPGARAPGIWITETNLDPAGVDPSLPAGAASRPLAGMTEADVEHLHAKAALRTLTAFTNKGVDATYLYAAKASPNLQLISGRFYDRLAQGGYPGDDAGGETMTAVRRLTEALGRGKSTPVHPLRLVEISDSHDHRQFAGDGTAAHPPLYDRDVLAFFPFQVTRRRYVVPVYVMTRDMATVYRPGASDGDPARFDLPDETFRLTIGGLPRGRLHFKTTDPITGKSTPVTVVARHKSQVTVKAAVTDYPRLMEITAGRGKGGKARR
jgi:hypothetical protein